MSAYTFHGARNTISTLISRLAASVIVLFVATSLLIAAWSPRAASPLISKTDWIVEGQASQNVKPDRFEVRDSIRNSPETVYWRTWSPQTGATNADIQTRPFVPSHYMAIPYGGFAGERGIGLNLVCLSSGNRLAVATARTNTQMTESLLELPRGWCEGKVVLEARARNASKYIEVGTPFKISWLDFYKDTFVGLFGLLVVIFSFAVGLLILPDVIRGLRNLEPLPMAVGFVCFGLVGYAMFFVYFYSEWAGRILSALLVLFEAGLLSLLAIYRREKFNRLYRQWKTPIMLWAMVVLVAFCLVTATNNGAGPWSVNAIFNPVRWSSDNQLPMMISEYLFHGLDPRTLNLGPWKVSDRPPLAYGLMSTFRLLSWLIASHKDGYPLYYQYEQLAGIVINGLWIVAVYKLLSAIKLDKRGIYLVMLAVAMTSFAVFNSVYIWPKMLGAAFALLAFTQLFEPEKNLAQPRFERFGQALLWAAALSGLALMSHGGTAFGVIAAILIAVWYRGLPSPRLALGAVVIGLAVLVPWSLWQHFEQPPGNALVKFAFTGDFGFGQEKKGLLEAVREAYSSLSLSAWVDMKLHALHVLVVGEGSVCGVQEIAPISSFDGLLRSQDFFYLGPSLRFLALGFIPLLFLRKFSLKNETATTVLRFARILVGTGLFSIGLYALAGFHCYINHMQSYQAMLEIIAGLALALYVSERWYWSLVLVLSILYGLVVWVIDPITSATNLYVLPILTLIIVAAMIYRWFANYDPSKGSRGHSIG